MAGDGINISQGIGSGEAQVFQPFDDTEAMKVRYALNEKKKKEQEDRDKELSKDISSVSSKGIFQPHQQIFKEKIGDFRDYTKKNIDQLRKGDPNATLEWKNKLAQLQTDIDQSNQVRKSYDDSVRKLTESERNNLRGDSLDYAEKFFTDPNESYDPENDQFKTFDPNKLKQNVDFQKIVDTELFPHAKSVADANEQGGTYEKDGVRYNYESQSYPKKMVDKDIENKLLSDPNLYEDATYQFNNAEDKLGAKNPVEYYQKKYGFEIKKQKTTGSGGSKSKDYSFGDGTASNDKYNFVYSEGDEKNKSTINIASLDFPENKPLEFPDPNDPNKKIQFTPTQFEKGYEDKKGAWYLTGTDKDGNKVSYDVNDIKGKFEANYFINPKELINKIGGGGTVKTNTGGTTTEKTNPNRKFSKSKSGKKIYSDDGGKTWLYSE